MNRNKTMLVLAKTMLIRTGIIVAIAVPVIVLLMFIDADSRFIIGSLIVALATVIGCLLWSILRYLKRGDE